ncbi:MAG TPA: 2,3-diaminopropionate biosynthesis protein SbnB, partial [Thermoanaerobaculia bacterium]|nr:2,3-diaminopropionate biosynthesis protein SbnB [Thermoanaerobaculia bacterium]
MEDGSILALGASEIRSLLRGTERDLLEVVRDAYLAHRRRESALPHSTFLRFPGQAADRIIALPAYLGDGFEVAGVKWIASFPGNLSRGLARASAVLVLNSCDDGRPTAILEGSIVSARRTAASAALAARELTAGQAPIEEAGLVGTGLINFETARFLRVALP